MLPTSGSIYTYSYVAFGEVFAWMMGGALILELVIAASTVAAGWSGYVQGILHSAGYTLPDYFAKVPSQGGVINLPALIIVVFVGCVLYLGNKDSKKLNAILVFIKMAAIFAFILSAAPHFDSTNWVNFMPFGFNKVVFGASVLFFAFTGFGTLAAAAEECKNPKRDLTIGIIGSLVLSTVIYVIVGGLATGIVAYEQLDNEHALAHALSLNNSNIGAAIVATGAVCGMTTVIMMNIYGISRIFYVIARDGLLPKFLSRLHPKYDSPYITIVLFSAFTAILAALCPLQVLGELSSMGALIDYIVAVLVVMIFRFRLKSVVRPFKCPAIFVIGPMAFIASMCLLFQLIIDTDGHLLVTGKLIIYWFTAIFLLYCVRKFFINRAVPNV
jgi:APA family basic amino acid/polyamine antiporter